MYIPIFLLCALCYCLGYLFSKKMQIKGTLWIKSDEDGSYLFLELNKDVKEDISKQKYALFQIKNDSSHR